MTTATESLTAVAAEAYVFGYPLVYDITEVQRLSTDGMGSLPPAPLNVFAHARKLAGPDDDFVSVNNDTLYSIAGVDVGPGPVVLHVPDTADRYYVLQFIDAWTNNFAYVGRRATGTGEGEFLLVAPGWEGETPAGMRRITAPTRVFTIVGRFAVDGEADLPAVHALQDRLTLRAPEGAQSSISQPDPGVPEALAFFERMRVWMRAFPPPSTDEEALARLGLLGDEPIPPTGRRRMRCAPGSIAGAPRSRS